MRRLRLKKAVLHRLAIRKVPHGLTRRGTELARSLFDTYRPEVLVLENTDYPGSRRSRHLPGLTRAIADLAARQGIEVVTYTPAEVRQTLALPEGRVTRAALCEAIAARFPMLTHYLPRRRRQAYDPEPPYTNLFMAVAMGLAWDRNRKQSQRRPTEKSRK